MNTEPPSSGPSTRYQTSSRRKKANPATPAAKSTNQGGAAATLGDGAGASGAGAARRAASAAASATKALAAHALQSVARVPNPLQEPERGERAAGHRAQRVGAVEQPHRAPATVGVRLHGAHRRRERASHQQRWRGEDQRGEHEAQHGARAEAERERPTEAEVCGAREVEERRAQRGRRRDAQLQGGVQTERARVGVGAASQEETAGADAPDEDGEDRGRSGGGRAEDEAELALPGNLVDEGGQARAEEEGGDGQGAHAAPVYGGRRIRAGVLESRRDFSKAARLQGRPRASGTSRPRLGEPADLRHVSSISAGAGGPPACLVHLGRSRRTSGMSRPSRPEVDRPPAGSSMSAGGRPASGWVVHLG